MPILQAHNLSYQLPAGDILFHSVSVSMSCRRVGLVGRNGAGKSLLATILTGERMPTGGSVVCNADTGVFCQQPSHLLASEATIAEFLGVAPVLDALSRITKGECTDYLFESVGEQWDLPAQLARELAALGLPSDPQTPCATLSGGQLAILRLWQLFTGQHNLLVLDEPSNHLDCRARRWLKAQIQSTAAAVLLISHDRELLQEMEEIWELNQTGITVYGGNYAHYAAQKQSHEQALNRQIETLHKQQKQVQQQAQRSLERAAQRAAQGQKQRGSQAKCLLDKQKDRATASAASRNKNIESRQKQLQQRASQLQSAKCLTQKQAIHLSSSNAGNKKAITLINGVLAFGSSQPVNLQVGEGDKLHLQGGNGSGKSTLLKTLIGRLPLQAGELHVNTPLCYLDQHFSSVIPTLSLLDNLLQQSPELSESDARTLLAGIGFRRDKVFNQAETLSGGEKMKLAMLIVSHQPQQPFLLLDEPDNHLDLNAKILLAAALNRYQGGFILISHDSAFAIEAGVKNAYHLTRGESQAPFDTGILLDVTVQGR
ncbi:ABC-F family ATP-binding cassette domain-containing protein [Alteromonas sp. ZYF713]|nr:ABC-F family ATP-binding cassette domain-containing protein [Alteromonas sp. ZYF713]